MKHVIDALSLRLMCEARNQRARSAIMAVIHKDSLDRFDYIKAFYRSAAKEILAEPNGWGIDPYEVDWTHLFTPIEAAIWHEIRHYGVVMYPQLPVGPYFVDFGNPHAKVAIECDGKLYHDPAKDEIRDHHLADRGWRVYRISGRDCLTDHDEETGELSEAAKFAKYVRSEIERRLPQGAQA